MRFLILCLSFTIAFQSSAKTESVILTGKVVSFDAKTVTIEFGGHNQVFSREKLGKKFSSLKKGEIIEIDTENELVKKNK